MNYTDQSIRLLREYNFQEFLDENIKNIFVYETPEFNYHNYLCVETITTPSTSLFRRGKKGKKFPIVISGKFALQA